MGVAFHEAVPERISDVCACWRVWSEGAIDPKTLRKWVWPFIDALAELDFHLVSISFAFFIHELSKLNRTHLFCNRSDSRTGTDATMEATVSSVLMGPTCECASMVENTSLRSTKEVGLGTKWASAFKLGISAGQMALFCAEDTMTCQFFEWV